MPLGVFGDDSKGGCDTVAAASAAFTAAASFVASTSAYDAYFWFFNLSACASFLALFSFLVDLDILNVYDW